MKLSTCENPSRDAQQNFWTLQNEDLILLSLKSVTEVMQTEVDFFRISGFGSAVF